MFQKISVVEEKALNSHDIEFNLSNIYDGDKRIVVNFNPKAKRKWWSNLRQFKGNQIKCNATMKLLCSIEKN